MKENFKYVIAWLLLTVFAYNFVFSFLIIELSISLNRQSNEKYISEKSESRFEILKIADNTSIIRNTDSEIIYNGKSYDVKSEFKENGITYFYCYHDEKEDRLNVAFNETVKNNSDSQGNSQKNNSLQLIKQVEKNYYHEIAQVFNQYPSGISEKIVFNDSFSSNDSLKIISPPPKYFFS